MGGIEEIIRQIEEDSNTESDRIIKAAKSDCDRLKNDCDSEIAKYVEKDNSDIENFAKIELSKLKSSADSFEKQEILKVKQEIIADMIENAYEKITELPVEEYFELLLKIAKNNAHKDEEGIVFLCKKDLDRMPDDFGRKLSENGLLLKVSESPSGIKDGLVLSYGDIEENCTFSALIDAKREKLFDLVNEKIFRRQ